MDDLLGWQNTRWGMTEDQILDAVGTAHLAKQPREGGPKDFWYCDHLIENVDIAGYFFDIKFQMGRDTDQLHQVRLSHTNSTVAEPATAAFHGAQTVLAERFGTPSRDGTSEDLLWIFPTTTIRLSNFFLDDIDSSIFIIFSQTKNTPTSNRPSAF